MPAEPMPMLYDDLTDKLILLTAQEIGDVVNAYGHVREMPTTMIAFLHVMLERPPDMLGGRIMIPLEYFQGAYEQHDIVLASVQRAIDALKTARAAAG
jgi:hypothetical protein